MKNLSIVLPARNEAESLKSLLPEILSLCPGAEVIVVNDGSSDDTADVASTCGAQLVNHPYSMGNGAAIKAGARAASRKNILFMDADGQHDPKDIKRLIEKFEGGYDMVVGARDTRSHASYFRRIANRFYNHLASLMTGFRVEDLTSGFRVVNARKFRRFLYLLPNGFSYPTTSTMAFFRSGFVVGYVPIEAGTRIGKSKIRLLHDGFRFLLIIMKIGALFSPMRLFIPVSFALFFFGIAYYGYTYLIFNRFTNMSAVLFLSSLLIFLIGIVSEQVSSLHYRWHQEDDDD
jgi:glycosyltransferase involved in cell wall biosynthesis